jgi:hypothetical protein
LNPNDKAGLGGPGGAGDILDGNPGEGYLNPAPYTNANGGGGGGAAGRIRLNSTTSLAQSGMLSPAAGTTACSEGTPPTY